MPTTTLTGARMAKKAAVADMVVLTTCAFESAFGADALLRESGDAFVCQTRNHSHRWRQQLSRGYGPKVRSSSFSSKLCERRALSSPSSSCDANHRSRPLSLAPLRTLSRQDGGRRAGTCRALIAAACPGRRAKRTSVEAAFPARGYAKNPNDLLCHSFAPVMMTRVMPAVRCY